MTKDDLEDAFIEYAVDDIESAVELITTLFVGVHEAYVDLRGKEGDHQKQITIEGVGMRTIIIHAKSTEET